jgi:hypothetical protein
MSAADAAKWVHEARIGLTMVQDRFSATNSLSGWDAMNLFRATETIVKAVEVGSASMPSHTHSLVALSKRIGLWTCLPPMDAANLLTRVSSLFDLVERRVQVNSATP